MRSSECAGPQRKNRLAVEALEADLTARLKTMSAPVAVLL